MSEREIFCGEDAIVVRRWLRPDTEIEVGSLVPFMVSKTDAQFVRDNDDRPFVLRTPRDGWALEIMSVESAGTDGVWVSAKAMRRMNNRATQPSPVRANQGTLMGHPAVTAVVKDDE